MSFLSIMGRKRQGKSFMMDLLQEVLLCATRGHGEAETEAWGARASLFGATQTRIQRQRGRARTEERAFIGEAVRRRAPLESTCGRNLYFARAKLTTMWRKRAWFW